MLWKSDYEIGIPIIDTQHKQLFRFNDELTNAVKTGLKSSAIDTLLTQIGQYVARHFAMEEKYMEEVNYPKMAEQLQAHTAFIACFNEIQAEFNAQGLTPALVNRIRKELSEWINDHITGIDQLFGNYYRDHCQK